MTKLRIIIPLLIISLLSCSKHDNKTINKLKKLQANKPVNYKLSNGGIITLVDTGDGCEILYLGSKMGFSLSVDKKSFRTLGDIKDSKGNHVIDVADTNGDFIPDYIFKDGKRQKVETNFIEIEDDCKEQEKGIK